MAATTITLTANRHKNHGQLQRVRRPGDGMTGCGRRSVHSQPLRYGVLLSDAFLYLCLTVAVSRKCQGGFVPQLW